MRTEAAAFEKAVRRAYDRGDPVPPVPSCSDWFARGAREPAQLPQELGPDTPVWTWSDEQTSGFWLRMQLIEPAVHRWDAESATATPGPGAPRLAAGTAGHGGDVPLPAYRRSAILDRRLLG
ncbi:maleylpyruvate isomerase N-terminal domain-containing protein [Streptomyces virginiae]|uniref:maleylpyruvate isomerase N-terminal domain-containing protein n=1 Tax=Streptomyces virginiae TaxID=1961 RepID=UPI003452F56D